VHELSVTQAILDTALRHATREDATRVHRILLVVSELSDLQPLWLQRYFDHIAAGTAAAGAELEVERAAPEFACNNCSARFYLSLRGVDRVRCPECGASDCTLQPGTDYLLEEIEVS
jgi:hydrogenase nickel incorporation protein HypA/HybF